jgi:hypothetical protein
MNMTSPDIKTLLQAIGLTQDQAVELFNLIGAGPDMIKQSLSQLNAQIQTSIISEIDAFTLRAERDVVLIRFLTDDDFALYEPELFEQFKSSAIHRAFIARTQRAIERIGGEVTIAFMDSTFYETWLGVNDFDDSRDLRITWARQQIRGLSN